MRNRKGFTLIELVVVIAILGIVASAIAVTFNFTTRSFVKSGTRAQVQFEARYALSDIVKHLSVAGSVWVHNTGNQPGTIPSVASRHYCYVSGHTLYLGISGAPAKTYLTSLTDNTVVSIVFTPFAPVITGSTPDQNMIHITLNVDDYSISTDVYVQNSSTIANKLIFDNRNGSPGAYIEFE